MRRDPEHRLNGEGVHPAADAITVIYTAFRGWNYVMYVLTSHFHIWTLQSKLLSKLSFGFTSVKKKLHFMYKFLKKIKSKSPHTTHNNTDPIKVHKFYLKYFSIWCTSKKYHTKTAHTSTLPILTLISATRWQHKMRAQLQIIVLAFHFKCER
jgi:hypothetical protein